MKKVLISPSRYLQGEGELNNLGAYVKNFGSSALLVASNDDRNRVQNCLDESVKRDSFNLVLGGFNEECTKKEIERLRGIFSDHKCDVIIGLGGGKALDTAKAISYYEKSL